ncbi:unnamed protein product [Lactuca saligna]|uniref:Uncharacterized protein n=1 Tax=Lactuca saligna TaxID=75948 RepID=A0AA36ERE0_LACSI|nr:unnamed protein product [Lactuca saligna]
MSTSNPNATFPIVKLNFKGVFIRRPLSYTNDCKKLYYYERGAPLLNGLTPISNEMEYAGFIFDAYGTHGQISLYVDHIGDGINDMFESEGAHDDHDSCISGGNDEIGPLRDVIVDFNEEIVTMNRTCNDEFLTKLCA